jgi:hypothetical protein
MDLSGIISIGGMPGLYKVVAQAKSGLIVESLIDKKRFPAYASSKVSTLDDISVFTTGEDLPLKDVLKNILEKEKGKPALDHKSPEADLKKYFSEVVPEYDSERVYISDIKKIISWYNLLQKNDLLKEKEKEEEKKDSDNKPKLKSGEAKPKATIKPKTSNVKSVKTNAPKVKAQGVRKSGTA